MSADTETVVAYMLVKYLPPATIKPDHSQFSALKGVVDLRHEPREPFQTRHVLTHQELLTFREPVAALIRIMDSMLALLYQTYDDARPWELDTFFTVTPDQLRYNISLIMRGAPHSHRNTCERTGSSAREVIQRIVSDNLSRVRGGGRDAAIPDARHIMENFDKTYEAMGPLVYERWLHGVSDPCDASTDGWCTPGASYEGGNDLQSSYEQMGVECMYLYDDVRKLVNHTLDATADLTQPPTRPENLTNPYESHPPREDLTSLPFVSPSFAYPAGTVLGVFPLTTRTTDSQRQALNQALVTAYQPSVASTPNPLPLASTNHPPRKPLIHDEGIGGVQPDELLHLKLHRLLHYGGSKGAMLVNMSGAKVSIEPPSLDHLQFTTEVKDGKVVSTFNPFVSTFNPFASSERRKTVSLPSFPRVFPLTAGVPNRTMHTEHLFRLSAATVTNTPVGLYRVWKNLRHITKKLSALWPSTTRRDHDQYASPVRLDLPFIPYNPAHHTKDSWCLAGCPRCTYLTQVAAMYTDASSPLLYPGDSPKMQEAQALTLTALADYVLTQPLAQWSWMTHASTGWFAPKYRTCTMFNTCDDASCAWCTYRLSFKPLIPVATRRHSAHW